MNTWKCSILSAGITALSTGWAAATPAVVLDYVNLRVGPGYGYAIIEVIPAGFPVDAGSCVDGWCQVAVSGTTGYMDANYLSAARPPAVAYGAPAYYSPFAYNDRRYAGWTYPYGVQYGPNSAYYGGYYDGPRYVEDFADGYAKAGSADIAASRKLTDRAKRTMVAKSHRTAPSHVAKLTGGPSTTGAAATAAPRARTDQNSQY
jgi:Bacterial SH3 domain